MEKVLLSVKGVQDKENSDSQELFANYVLDLERSNVPVVTAKVGSTPKVRINLITRINPGLGGV